MGVAGPRLVESGFQSTHPRRVRPITPIWQVWPRPMFQSTHPRRVRPILQIADALLTLRFNPRTRAGCDAQRWQIVAAEEVSIHAPAQGATLRRAHVGRMWYGFNPRTRAGCDPWPSSDYTPQWSFQSTHPRRVRPEDTYPGPDEDGVSIHAPAQGATSGVVVGTTIDDQFQSTHPRRVRPCVTSGAISRRSTFQSTHPRRVRRQPITTI